MIHRNFKLKNRNQIKEVLKKINVDNHQLVEKGYSSYSTVLDYEKFGVFDKIIEKFLMHRLKIELKQHYTKNIYLKLRHKKLVKKVEWNLLNLKIHLENNTKIF